MRELKFLNIGYYNNLLDNEINDYLISNTKNLSRFNNEDELVNLVNEKKINLLITTYNYESLKKVRKINDNIQVVAILDELKKEYLKQSVELEHIKFLQNLNCKEEFKNVLKDCIKQLDSNKSNIIKLKNDFIYDLYNKTLIKKDEIVSLSNKEALFLDLLLRNPNRALNYEEIQNEVWDENMSQDALRSVVKELRKKVYKELIKNVSGVGYRADFI